MNNIMSTTKLPSQNPVLLRIAGTVSGISSPFIVVTVFALAIILVQPFSLESRLFWALEFLLFIVILPVAYVWNGVRTGRYTDFHLMVREQRTEPFLVSIVGGTLFLLLAIAAHFPQHLIALAWVLLINGVVFAIITHYWKISIHVAALTGSIVMVGALLCSQLFWLFLAVPLVAWARLYRKRHSLAQAMVASLVVAGATLVVLVLLGQI
jgi:hypothetical protein